MGKDKKREPKWVKKRKITFFETKVDTRGIQRAVKKNLKAAVNSPCDQSRGSLSFGVLHEGIKPTEERAARCRFLRDIITTYNSPYPADVLQHVSAIAPCVVATWIRNKLLCLQRALDITLRMITTSIGHHLARVQQLLVIILRHCDKYRSSPCASIQPSSVTIPRDNNHQ